ncbi:hypothetical protein X977_5760 [Burkholderia pseudomallei MSHR7504]|nr:hypothetical protein X977_5760 [Burkholderia pseudomallei MSHR7504]
MGLPIQIEDQPSISHHRRLATTRYVSTRAVHRSPFTVHRSPDDYPPFARSFRCANASTRKSTHTRTFAEAASRAG